MDYTPDYRPEQVKTPLNLAESPIGDAGGLRSCEGTSMTRTTGHTISGIDQENEVTPHANRGVEGGQQSGTDVFLSKSDFIKLPNLTYLRSGFDCLRLTTGPEVSKFLFNSTEFEEDFGKQPGFKLRERRECLGGLCDRNYLPRQSSTLFGLDYELWVWTSAITDINFRNLISSGVPKINSNNVPNSYATRLDYAMDFSCPHDFYPNDALQYSLPWIEKHGFSVSGAGDLITGTRYIGSRTSERYLRIYRKDIEDLHVACTDGPVLRYEIELKGRYSRCVYFDSLTDGYDEAACHAILHAQLQSGIYFGVHPSRFTIDNQLKSTTPIKRVSSLLRQYGCMMYHLERLGVDLSGLSSEIYRNAGSESRRRSRRLCEELATIGDISDINELLAVSLGAFDYSRKKEV